MNYTFYLLLLLTLLTASAPQTITINNRGCKTYNADKVCVECATRYYLDAEAICQPVNPNCKTYNTSNGHCLSCYPGFGIVQDTCLPGVASSYDSNCNTFNGSVCVKCSQGFYLSSSTGKCSAVDPSCHTYDESNGKCTSCFAGYAVKNGKCEVETSNELVSNCNEIDPLSGACLKCSLGYYFNSLGKCVQQSPSCKTFDAFIQVCTQCYPGYSLSQNKTCLETKAQSIDPNCKIFKSGVCVECSSGSIFSLNGKCIVVDPTCATHNSLDGTCTSCYSGYSLSLNNSCVKATEQGIDPNCKKFTNSVCTECSSGSIFNKNKKCITVDPSCYTFDELDGHCTSCYPGYEVKGISCVPSNSSDVKDPFCKSFLQNICVQCSYRYFINDLGICEEVSPLCNNYDNLTGSCLSCYPGFVLAKTTCLKEEKVVADEYCKTWNGSQCIECSFGAFFLGNGTCKAANPLCKTFDSKGACTSCYDSFQVQNQTCIKSKAVEQDPNCASFFGDVCLECSKGFIFLNSGNCGMINPNCKSYSDMTGECLSCYMGYVLVNGECLNSTKDVSSLDPNCAAFNGSVCITCSKNFFFKSGICTAVDPLCKGYNSTSGACIACYQSFLLASGLCIQDKNHTLSDANCASWLQGVCVKCATRTFMNSQGKCQDVSINCNTYTPINGQCTSCYPGFTLSSGTCQKSESQSSCSKFSSDGACSQCGKGSYLSEGSCILIDAQCADFNINTLTCSSCYPGYSLLSGSCQVSSVNQQYKVENCYAYDGNSQCIKCYDRFYLDSNSCKAVNVFCKTYDDVAGSCLSCYSTFILKNGECTQ